MALFPPTRSLIYPQFETYRLQSLSPDDDVLAYPLPAPGATQSRFEYGKDHLSFKEVRARIAWDHLAVGEGGRGLYVDKDWNVVGFQFDDQLKPEFTVLASLPTPIASDSSSSSSSYQHPEYPSIVPLNSTKWVVSAGTGSVYILSTSPAGEPFTASFISQHDLVLPASSTPVESSNGGTSSSASFLIQAARTVSENEVRLLLSASVPPASQGRKRGQVTEFELFQVILNPSTVNEVDGSSSVPMQIDWRVRGGDIPLHCACIEDEWMILSGETYVSLDTADTSAGNAKERERLERDERIAKLGLGASLSEPATKESDHPMAEASSNSSTVVHAAGENSSANTRPSSSRSVREQPFTWTQTGDSASISIPFPAGTKRSDFTIRLKPEQLELSLNQPSPSSMPSGPTPLHMFLKYPAHSFWAPIDLDLSSYSYNPSSSVLEIDLDKVDSNNRWPAIFLPAGDDDPDEEEVPETLSSSTLAAVRETFNNIRTRQEGEPAGNHPAIPSLLREEIDFEMEDEGIEYEDGAGGVSADGGGGRVGRDVFIGIISQNGEAKWSKSTTSVISLPFKGVSEPELATNNGLEEDGSNSGLVIKSAVDGLYFTPSTTSEIHREPWAHSATIPALAFVLSSKRDIRLVRHLIPSHCHLHDTPSSPKKAKLESAGSLSTHPVVMAFDSGSSSAGQGNVYVYYPPDSKTVARQGVIRVSGGERGAMLGVGCVSVGGKDVVIALCERELVVLNGVL